MEIGDKVINPDVTSNSPNYIGVVADIKFYKNGFDNFVGVVVQFRDYRLGFNKYILKLYTDDNKRSCNDSTVF